MPDDTRKRSITRRSASASLVHYAGGPPDFYELGEPAKPFRLAAPPKER
jgi:hypothetical protein